MGAHSGTCTRLRRPPRPRKLANFSLLPPPSSLTSTSATPRLPMHSTTRRGSSRPTSRTLRSKRASRSATRASASLVRTSVPSRMMLTGSRASSILPPKHLVHQKSLPLRQPLVPALLRPSLPLLLPTSKQRRKQHAFLSATCLRYALCACARVGVCVAHTKCVHRRLPSFPSFSVRIWKENKDGCYIIVIPRHCPYLHLIIIQPCFIYSFV